MCCLCSSFHGSKTNLKKVKIHYVGFHAKQFSLLEVLILSEGINTSLYNRYLFCTLHRKERKMRVKLVGLRQKINGRLYLPYCYVERVQRSRQIRNTEHLSWLVLHSQGI